MIFLILITIGIGFIMYNRYFPVFGVSGLHLKDLKRERIIKVIDVRDYNESYKYPIKRAINIPIGYLKRNLKEIPKGDLHVVVSSSLEKNFAIRYLRHKGFRVVSYTVIEQKDQLFLKENSLKIEMNG